MMTLMSVILNLSLFYLLSVSSHGGSEEESNSDNHHDLRSKSLILTKLWCLVIVFFATFCGGISPYFMKWRESFLVVGIQFAGGVFLGTAMMHFLSDSNQTFGDLTQKEYPFAFMLACSGYLLTMLSDCAVSHVFKSGSIGSQLQGDIRQDKESQSGHSARPQSWVHDGGGDSNVSGQTSFGDSILLIVALCFHSVFEGIAIGVAETDSDAWKALWTVCLHKVFAAIAMGIALLGMIPNRPLLSSMAYAFAFGISSPIGVAVGLVIDATTQGAVADWIYAISMGIACGVFLYVSINHLLSTGYTPRNRVPVDTPFYRFLAVLLGVAVIAVVMIWD